MDVVLIPFGKVCSPGKVVKMDTDADEFIARDAQGRVEFWVVLLAECETVSQHLGQAILSEPGSRDPFIQYHHLLLRNLILEH